MIQQLQLPDWLDNCIFGDLSAKYCRSKSDMQVIDWDKNDLLNYLGTYFPRSYAEAYCIYSDYFQNNIDVWGSREELSVFDFGCGTGGEIVGLLMAVNDNLPNVKAVSVLPFDGNQDALKLFEKVAKQLKAHISFELRYRVLPFVVEDFYDLSVLDGVLGKYDIIMSFKAICEFVSKERFEQCNAYAHISKCLLPRLPPGGIMLLVDVTTYSSVSQEWLPRMIDSGLAQSDAVVVSQNSGYNQSFYVSHSHCKEDKSKVAWRIITN